MIVKNEEEKNILREGGRRLAEIRNILAEKTVAGISTAELDRIAFELCSRDGDSPAFLNYTPRGAPRPFPASICVSVNEVVVHGIPTENPRIIKDGDLVSIDVGLVHRGLITDSAVTVAVGRVTERERELIKTAESALYAAIDAVKPGVRVAEISSAIERVVLEKGFSIPEELGGHGVGKSLHEDPSIPNISFGGSGPSLREGEVVAIEPIITIGGREIAFDYVDGYTVRTSDSSKSAHVEHTILVTKDGAEILTA